MMHGHEKSDSVIVAVKPANKAVHPAAEQSAAEPVAAEPAEPRAETKGNADQQSTCRTQSRISVSQALDACGKQLPFGPEVGAVCGKAARTDLRGGRSAMSVPTASLLRVHVLIGMRHCRGEATWQELRDKRTCHGHGQTDAHDPTAT